MAKEKPVSRRDLIQRINSYARRNLEKVRTETGLRLWNDAGEYGFEKDGEIFDRDISQMEDFAREIGVLHPEEKLATEEESES